MEVTLSTGKTVQIAALTLGQIRRMTEAVDAGKTMDATVQACADALRNADPSGAPVAPAWFEDNYTLPEANEIFAKVMEVSGLKAGEAAAGK